MPSILPNKNYATKSIGCLGSDIIFECSSELVRTFKDYKRETKARFATHALIMQMPALEFLGQDCGEISFKMIFTTSLGVNPVEETDKLRKICAAGEANVLVIGSEVIGDMWVIESLNESAQAHDGSGRIILSEVNLTLKEYRNESTSN